MKRSTDAFFGGVMEGEELKIFRDYRKQDNQFPDPLLDDASTIHYNFYSIGPGGLGITSYKKLPDSAVEIFKRFHNCKPCWNFVTFAHYENFNFTSFFFFILRFFLLIFNKDLFTFTHDIFPTKKIILIL